MLQVKVPNDPGGKEAETPGPNILALINSAQKDDNRDEGRYRHPADEERKLNVDVTGNSL